MGDFAFLFQMEGNVLPAADIAEAAKQAPQVKESKTEDSEEEGSASEE